jgi:hypothetical protein
VLRYLIKRQWRRQGFWRPGANVIYVIFVAPFLGCNHPLLAPSPSGARGQLPPPDPPPRCAATGTDFRVRGMGCACAREIYKFRKRKISPKPELHPCVGDATARSMLMELACHVTLTSSTMQIFASIALADFIMRRDENRLFLYLQPTIPNAVLSATAPIFENY